MTLEEEVRFNNAGKQLMSAINRTGFASQYNVSNSQLQGNFIYHFVESMLPNTYPHKATWQTMILSVLKLEVPEHLVVVVVPILFFFQFFSSSSRRGTTHLHT